MPLELGIAMARRFLNRRAAMRHDWLVIVPAGHGYARYISDLAGFDPVTHDSTEPSLIAALMSWLATRVDAVDTLSPRQVLMGLPCSGAKYVPYGKPGGNGRPGLTSFWPPSRSPSNSVASVTLGCDNLKAS
jgi:hypothetical protein